ncbi:TetR/AcrR family transcriptional regulator [Nocardia jejuensis]|uniref:TetR/AcrR family transcriptional regulator n=1 Tax=Nocardia jejuensis TaxID=328049 RepID=UPI00082A01B9|nr:TetR/AcrR family transcriptional regulator [Nocardia jejuensis]
MARSDDREEAILLGTLELIGEVGYDQMTMDGIATRARASKATIYRRWPGKAELVVAALERYSAPPTIPPDSGTLRGDLLGLLATLRDNLAGQDASLVLGLMKAMHHDSALARVVRSRLVDVKRAAFDAVAARAVAREQLSAEADHVLAAEVASAVLFSRLLITDQPLDDAFITHLVDAVLLPILHR